MRKEDLVSAIVYILMIAVVITVGICVVRPILSQPGVNNSLWPILVDIIIAIIVNTLLWELGHVIGAKIGGYKVMSFCVLGFTIYRNINRWKFKFTNFDGLTGETKIAPKKEKTNLRVYSLVSLFLYIIELVGLLVCINLWSSEINEMSTISSNFTRLADYIIAAICFVTIGGMMAIYNMFPARLDCLNDGYRLVLSTKKNLLEQYNEFLKIEGSYMEDTNPSIKIFYEINDFTSVVNLYATSHYLNEKKYDEALGLIDQILANKNKVNVKVYNLALAQKIYTLIIAKGVDIAKEFYSGKVASNERRFISTNLDLIAVRTYLLIASVFDASEHEAKYTVSRATRALKNSEPGRAKVENSLYLEALEKVNLDHPEWHIKDAR